MDPSESASRKKSKGFLARRHTRRMSADDIVIRGRPLSPAKSAPNMNMTTSNMSLHDDDEDIRLSRTATRQARAMEMGKRSLDLITPRKSLNMRSKSRDAVRDTSKFSLDLDRRPTREMFRPDPKSRIHRSVDDMLDRRTTDHKVSFKTSTHNLFGATNSSAAAPRLIATAALAPSISVAINHPDMKVPVRKHTSPNIPRLSLQPLFPLVHPLSLPLQHQTHPHVPPSPNPATHPVKAPLSSPSPSVKAASPQPLPTHPRRQEPPCWNTLRFM
ncbi:hypothetical protein BC829DRAFT_119205 [Chytridium lagenaria]|nr:hypothetical protein BC829DRAFT_119205 [Chytridium lagenaria]